MASFLPVAVLVEVVLVEVLVLGVAVLVLVVGVSGFLGSYCIVHFNEY